MALPVLLIASLTLVSCSFGQPLRSILFNEIPPSMVAETSVRTSDTVTIDGVTTACPWRKILESNTSYPGFDGNPWISGTVLDKDGNIITTVSPATARDFDMTTIFEKFGKIWMVTQNEDSNGMFFLMEMNQDPTTGALTIAKGKSLNVAAVKGSIRPCSGSLTPWNSHLGGLEDVVDARTFPPTGTVGQFVAQAVQQKLPSWRDVNPYWYGGFIQVQVSSAAGDATVLKHYVMGRAPWETGVVLPDQRTVICADDTSSGGIMTLFVADKPKDLSCGRLFTSKPGQLNMADGGSFKMEWIELTNGTSICDSQIEPLLGNNWNESIKFSDMFDFMAPVYNDATNTVANLSAKPADFFEVKSIGSRYEWLRLKPGMRNIAAVLETARMSSYYRGCTEWTKMEGVTYDWRTREVYFALTAIQRSMLDQPRQLNQGDLGGPNQIRVPLNTQGAVYRMETAPVEGISWYTPVTARAVITAWSNVTTTTTTSSSSVNSAYNTVDVRSISNPDNVGFLPRYRNIFIAEDSDYHLSNYGWMYNVDSGEITRVMSTPLDAEVTAGYYFPNVGAFSYLMATVQHPRAQDMPCTVGAWTLPKEV